MIAARHKMTWRCRGRDLCLGERTLIMGIVNVTPDSFYDGGVCLDARAAERHGLRLAEEGADILDVGGESSRPGALPVPAEEELRRVLPVIERLARVPDLLLSVDTRHADVARAALDAGAHVVNDITGLLHDPDMPALVARTGAGAILMHMRGTPRTMQDAPAYKDVTVEVRAWMQSRLDALSGSGVNPASLAIDPGFGFGKSDEHNFSLLARLGEFSGLGRPLVVGWSRKSSLGRLTGRAVNDRLAASLAAMTAAVLAGAHIVRVHDVKESCDAAGVADALLERVKQEGKEPPCCT